MLLTAPAHDSDPILTILIVLAAAAVWGMSLLARPIGTCPTCRGHRITRTRTRVRVRVRVRPCRTCQGTGLRRRTGATTLHRLYWTFHGEQQRQQRRAQLDHTPDRPDTHGPQDR